MKRTIAVVGGGPAGLLAAHIAAKKGHDVVLIEQEDTCGGLMRSFANQEGVEFDYGTHFLKETGLSELDHLLYKEVELDKEKWNSFPYLKTGVFFQNRLSEASAFADLHALGDNLHDQAAAEILKLGNPAASESATCEEHLLKNFGPTVVANLFAPAMQKLLGAPLRELAPTAHELFGLGRVIAFTPEKSRELKKDPSLNARLAFHSSREGISGQLNFYPADGGIGLWAVTYTDLLKRLGVKIETGTRVTKISAKNGKLELSSGSTLSYDQIVWTIPAFLALKAAGTEFKTAPPKIRVSNLYYFIFDQKLRNETYFFTCLDPEYSFFRITDYSNMRTSARAKTQFAICVESLADKPDSEQAGLRLIPEELKKMKLLGESAKVVYAEARCAKAGFPVATPAQQKATRELGVLLEKEVPNLLQAGKAAGGGFFLNDVLIQTYREMSEQL